MKGDSYVWTLLQSSVLSALRELQHKNASGWWTVNQIRSQASPRWGVGREQTYNCLKSLEKEGLAERGISKLRSRIPRSKQGSVELPLAGYRITARGIQERDRFLSIITDQTKRCNALIGAERNVA